MGRSRSRIHFGELRTLRLSQFQRGLLAPAARWHGTTEWPDGATVAVEKLQDAGLAVAYATDGGHQDVAVEITHSPRHFGGTEPYFCCPRCGRRCRVLYFVGAGLRCRRCIRGLYYCQVLDPAGQALRRFRALRNRIRPGTENERLDYFPRRPKGMRRVTYQRIKAAALAALERYHAALDVKLVAWLNSLEWLREQLGLSD